MKKYIKSNTNNTQSNRILDILKASNIDTTLSQYELKAEAYERYGAGDIYVKKFKCPGDYLAYFSMLLHESPTTSNMLDYMGDLEELEYYVEEYPTVNDIANHAASSWWGDGDDYIIYLKNLTTGEILYQGQDEGYDEYDEEDDWE